MGVPFFKIIQNNNEYDVVDKVSQGMIAQPFSANKSGGYNAGDVIIYDNKLYKFTSAHNGAWTGLDVEQVDVIGMFPNAIKLDLETTTTYKTLLTNIVTVLQSMGINDLSTIKDCKLMINSIGENSAFESKCYRLSEKGRKILVLMRVYSNTLLETTFGISVDRLVINTDNTRVSRKDGTITFNTSSVASMSAGDTTNSTILNDLYYNSGYAEFIWE